jgi:hypothetical protein
VLVIESGFGLEQTAPLRVAFACNHVLLRSEFNWSHEIVTGAIRILLPVEVSGQALPRVCDCAIEIRPIQCCPVDESLKARCRDSSAAAILNAHQKKGETTL